MWTLRVKEDSLWGDPRKLSDLPQGAQPSSYKKIFKENILLLPAGGGEKEPANDLSKVKEKQKLCQMSHPGWGCW